MQMRGEPIVPKRLTLDRSVCSGLRTCRSTFQRFRFNRSDPADRSRPRGLRSATGGAEEAQACFDVPERRQKFRIFVRQLAEPEIGAKQRP